MKTKKPSSVDSKRRKNTRVARFISNSFVYYQPNPIPCYQITDSKIPSQENSVQNLSHPQIIYSYQPLSTMQLPMPNNNAPTDTMKQSNTTITIENNTIAENSSFIDKIFELKSISQPIPRCVFEAVPKNFDILQRGSLPGIVFHNNKINILLWKFYFQK